MLAVEKQKLVPSSNQVAPPASYSSVPVAVVIDTKSVLQDGVEYVKPKPEDIAGYLEDGNTYEEILSGYYGGGVGGLGGEDAIAMLEEATPFIDLSSPSRNGMNPMTYAAQEGHLAGLKWFVEHENPNFRLNPFLADSDGRTALHAAARKGSIEILEYLLNFAVKDFRKKGQYTSLSDNEIKRQMLSLTDNVGDNCLHHACSKDSLDMVQYLLIQYGMDLSSTNKDGETPFVASYIYSRTFKVTEFLMAAPYNKHLTQAEYPNKHNLTPIHFSDVNKQSAKLAISLELALKHSVDFYSQVLCQLLESQDTMAVEKYSREIKNHERLHAGNKAVKAAVQDAFNAYGARQKALKI